MYTEGEWKVTSNKLTKVTFPNKLTVRSNTGCPIALLTDAERSNADAHLIAAAPELYEALKALIPELQEYIKDIGDCDHSVGICFCGLFNKLELVEQAIAKAEVK